MKPEQINDENIEIILPQDIYNTYLTIVNGITFTRREVDVISCMLSGRSAKTTASFLSISPKTVENHIRNVMLKLSCKSQESIRDFIEKSGKFNQVKKYYSSLLIQANFELQLNKISVIVNKNRPACIIIYDNEQAEQVPLLSQLERHLNLTGVKTAMEARERYQSTNNLIDKVESRQVNYIIYSLPAKFIEQSKIDNEIEDLSVTSLIEANSKYSDSIIILLLDRPISVDVPKELLDSSYIDLAEQRNYYFLVFETIKKLLPNVIIEKNISEFKLQCAMLYDSSLFQAKIDKVFPGYNKIKRKFKLIQTYFLTNKKWYLSLAIILFFGLFGTKFLALEENKEKRKDKYKTGQEEFVHLGLILPKKSTFLDRDELIQEMDNKFREKNAIQTIALVGMGGAGKTTLAQKYASLQNAQVICVINGETKESLKRSFEDLAKALSKTKEDENILRDLQYIKETQERDDKFLQFVKKRLKLNLNWILIFDNVEKIHDIQEYFPHDFTIWGQGKVILTTRDINIQNNKYVNHVVQLGKLNTAQKGKLFAKIINDGNRGSYISVQDEEIRKILEEIPPFPLDVTIAASYIKSANMPYKRYLEDLSKHNKDFTVMQEDITKESGDYTKTRYGIITSSVEKLISSHKDFEELLLFMSLLNSQDIPRDLLDKYKGENVVDSFIYNLKKYSLIEMENGLSVLFPASLTFSLHRSTQAIILIYLSEKLNLGKNHKFLEGISNHLKNYMFDAFDKQNFLQMNSLASHPETFLSHSDLLTEKVREAISVELASIYTYKTSDNFLKAIPLLERCLINLSKNNNKDYENLGKILNSLGLAYWNVGNYEKVKNLSEESLLIYNKYFPENYSGIGRALSLLGNAHRALGNYEKAENLLEQSLKVYEKEHVKNYHKIAGVLSFLGFSHYELANYEKSKDLLEESLMIYSKYYPENHYGISRALALLGNSYRKLKNYEEAKDVLEESVSTSTKIYNKNHYSVVWTLACLGNVYREIGNYKKAKDFIEHGITNFEKSFGENHIETARMLLDLGEVYLLEDHMETAENLMNRALKIFQQNKHPGSYMALEGLAELHLKKSTKIIIKKDSEHFQDFKAKAIAHLSEALKIAKIHFPEGSPHVSRIQSKINLLYKSGR